MNPIRSSLNPVTRGLLLPPLPPPLPSNGPVAGFHPTYQDFTRGNNVDNAFMNALFDTYPDESEAQRVRRITSHIHPGYASLLTIKQEPREDTDYECSRGAIATSVAGGVAGTEGMWRRSDKQFHVQTEAVPTFGTD